MSFASGLFSFLGGASGQFRQEIDLANQYKIDQAKLIAEQEQAYNELLFEQQKHNDSISIQQQGIDLDNFINIYNNAGGVAGFSNGGLVTAKTNTSLKLNRDQMRMAFSPQQINDFDLTQIVNDKEMSVDFARIKDRVDLDEFNDKYDTKIILPLV